MLLNKPDKALKNLLDSVEALCSTLKTHRPENYPHVKTVLQEIACKCYVTYPTASSWIMERRFQPSGEARTRLETWSLRTHLNLEYPEVITYKALLSAVKRVRAVEEQNL